jgi:hypothetical protein
VSAEAKNLQAIHGQRKAQGWGDGAGMSKGIGMPATLKLEWFARVIHEFFGEYAYHVGSSLKCSLGQAETWRDVDVRLILPDENFDALFGTLTEPRCLAT